MGSEAGTLDPRQLGARSALRVPAPLGALLFCLIAALGVAVLALGADSRRTLEPLSAYGELPLSFEPSRGRYGPGTDFVASSGAGSVAAGPGGISFAQHAGKRSEAVAISPIAGELADPRPLERLPGVVNDLRGNDPSKWKTEIPTFERVRYREVWPGIDLDLRGSSTAPEYDLRLGPGADPTEIALRISGADSARITPGGDLVIGAGKARFRQRAPLAFQPGPDGRDPVESAFTLEGKRIGFSLGPYDRSRPLVIDPLVISYSTYLGGSSAEAGNAIALDGAGAAYVTGSTTSADLPSTSRAADTTHNGNYDAFVAKFNPAGSALVYSTYLGGDNADHGNGIALDSTGAAYVTGSTYSTDFPTTSRAPDTTHNGFADAFIAKLNPAGSALVYATYLGGAKTDHGNGIALGSTGAAYVTGYTSSDEFPATSGAADTTYNGNYDAFIAKLNPAGRALVYATYLGSSDDDLGNGIAVDSAGAAFVTGYTDSTSFPVTEGAAYTTHLKSNQQSSSDAFIAKLNPAGSALVYSTYLGGASVTSDWGDAIAVDSGGAAYVTGSTVSYTPDHFPTTTGTADTTYNGDLDAFVAKLNPAGSALVYATYLGGSKADTGNGIAADSTGAAYVTGETGSDNLPTTTGAADTTHNGGLDAFVAKLNPAGSELAEATYLGDVGNDWGRGIALDSTGAAFVTGNTESDEFPATTAAADTTHNGFLDAFIAKLADPDADPDGGDGGSGGGGSGGGSGNGSGSGSSGSGGTGTTAEGHPTCNGAPATVIGTDAGDQLFGTDEDDVIVAFGGDDVIKGGAGDDVICAGDGDDRAIGQGGKDEILGESGDDKLVGGKAKDKLKGGGGADTLKGGAGAKDKLKGQGGADKLNGGAGRKDLCNGGAGKDKLKPKDPAKHGCEKVKKVP